MQQVMAFLTANTGFSSQLARKKAWIPPKQGAWTALEDRSSFVDDISEAWGAGHVPVDGVPSSLAAPFIGGGLEELDSIAHSLLYCYT
jgi:hypothetical protein